MQKRLCIFPENLLFFSIRQWKILYCCQVRSRVAPREIRCKQNAVCPMFADDLQEQFLLDVAQNNVVLPNINMMLEKHKIKLISK